MELTNGAIVSAGYEPSEEHLAMESDHDLIIRLYERMEQWNRDRNEMHKNIAKIEIALEKLERESASIKFGWKLMVGLMSGAAAAAGIAADFLFHK